MSDADPTPAPPAESPRVPRTPLYQRCELCDGTTRLRGDVRMCDYPRHLAGACVCTLGKTPGWAEAGLTLRQVEKIVAERDRLRAENDRLHQRVCDFQAAAMIEVGGVGGPCLVEPRHLERHMEEVHRENDRLRAEVERLRAAEAVCEKLLWHFPDLDEILGGQSVESAKELIAMARAALARRAGGEG